MPGQLPYLLMDEHFYVSETRPMSTSTESQEAHGSRSRPLPRYPYPHTFNTRTTLRVACRKYLPSRRPSRPLSRPMDRSLPLHLKKVLWSFGTSEARNR